MESRVIKIYQQAQTVQNATQNMLAWRIQWEDEQTKRWTNPLMGWTSTSDPLSNTHMTVEFATAEDAARFCQQNGMLPRASLNVALWTSPLDVSSCHRMPEAFSPHFSTAAFLVSGRSQAGTMRSPSPRPTRSSTRAPKSTPITSSGRAPKAGLWPWVRMRLTLAVSRTSTSRRRRRRRRRRAKVAASGWHRNAKVYGSSILYCSDRWFDVGVEAWLVSKRPCRRAAARRSGCGLGLGLLGSRASDNLNSRGSSSSARPCRFYFLPI